MDDGFLTRLVASETGLTTLAGLVALTAVWFPFYRGMRVCLRAAAATRRVHASDLRRGRGASEGGGEPLALLFVRVLRQSLREGGASERLPREFLLDATKQYVLSEYETHYARPISMYANLLPPIGFTGTTIGILMRLLSMHLSNQALELGALGTALVATVLALLGFASMESVKVLLYNRLLRCLDEAILVARLAESEGSGGGASPPPVRAARHATA
jgi:hypothetical protein